MAQHFFLRAPSDGAIGVQEIPAITVFLFVDDGDPAGPLELARGINDVVRILVGLDPPEGAADGGGELWGMDRFAFGGGKFGEEGCDRFFM